MNPPVAPGNPAPHSGPPPMQDPRSGTSLQKPPPPRTIGDYISGTLRYIGNNPIQFAMSVGMGMAVSFGVKMGMVAMGMGLGPFGLAIGAAMVTSVILNVGRKLWRGESINLEDLAGKSLFSGIFAGVLGGIFGFSMGEHVSVGEHVDTALRDIPSGNPDAPLPEGVAELKTDLKPELPSVSTQLAMLQERTDAIVSGDTKIFFDPANPDNLPDQFAHYTDPIGWNQVKNYFTANNLDYMAVQESHTLDQLMEAEKDYYVYIDDDNLARYAISHEQLQDLHCEIENAHAVAGIPQPEHVIIHNTEYPGAAYESTPLDPDVGHNIHLDMGTLTLSKDAAHFAIDQVVGSGVAITESPSQYYLEKILSHSSGTELQADAFALQDGNYKGAFDNFAEAAKMQDKAITGAISKIQSGAWDDMHKMVEVAEELKLPIDETILTSGNKENIKAAVLEQLKKMNGLEAAIADSAHPSIRDRLLHVMEHAAADDRLQQAEHLQAYMEQLEQTQAKFDAMPSLRGKIDLQAEWESIVKGGNNLDPNAEKNTDHEAVHEGTKEDAHAHGAEKAKPDFSQLLGHDPLLEQVAHLNTHLAPAFSSSRQELSHVERLMANGPSKAGPGRG